MPILIQALGVDNFGWVNLSLSIIFLANVLVGYGYNLSGPREIALQQENKRALGATLSRILISKTILATFAAMVILASGFIFGFFSGYKIILMWSLILLFSEATTTTWFFQGLEKMGLPSVTNIFSKLLYLLVLVWFIQGPEMAIWVNFILGLTAFGMNILLLIYIHRTLSIRLHIPKLPAVWISWKENLMLFLSGFASHIAVNGGIIILSFFASAKLLGLYSIAERIGMVLRIVPAIITQAAYPNASKLFAKDLGQFYKFLRKVQLGAIGISILISLSIVAFAPNIIRVLSKENFTASVEFLRILAFLPLLASLNISNMLIILVADQKRLLFNSTWIFCVYMLVVSSFMAHRFGGAGLAYALLSTEFFIFLICSFLLQLKTPRVFNGFYRTLFRSHPAT